MANYRGWGVLAAVLLAAAGCVHQDREVAAYRAVLDGHAPATARPAGRPFGAGTTLTLGEALALAARDNEPLAMQGEEYVQALIDKDRAFATFLPSVSLVPVYFQRETFPRDGLPESLTPFHGFDLPVAGQANLFNGFRDTALLKGSKLAIEQRRALLLDAQSLLLLEVAQTYYAVLKAEKAAEVLDSSLAVEERRVREVGDKLAQGVARELDLQQARAQAAATRVRLTGARRAMVAGRATLAVLIGVPSVQATLVDRYPTPGQAEELEPLLALAEKHRCDLRAAHSARLAARQEVDRAVGQYYPSVSVGALAFLYKQSWPADSQFAGVLGAHVPLFDAGRIHADVRTAWSRYRQSVLAESWLNRQVAAQVEIARADFMTSVQQVGELRTALAAAESAFRIASQSYDQGLATNLDVLDAQDRLLSARLQLAAEGYQTTVCHLNLLRVTGRLDGPTAGTAVPPPAG
ncbi:MAG: TolC family protein [Lentisphaeria bacterium]